MAASKIQITSARQLRANLRHYLDLLESGKEVVIVRNSRVIGSLAPPPKPRKPRLPSKKIDNQRTVTFRQLGKFEDPQPVIKLHQQAEGVSEEALNEYLPGSDIIDPNNYYDLWDGEFWIGELNGDVVAAGGFIKSSDENNGQAVLERLQVKPELSGLGIEEKLRSHLAKRAAQMGYKLVVLNTARGGSLPLDQSAKGE